MNLESSVPLYRACNLAVTISGLAGSDTLDTPTMNITSLTDANPFPPAGAWHQATLNPNPEPYTFNPEP